MLVISGENKIGKADALVGKIKEMVGKQQFIKIRKPCRTSEIKIWGVDETANKVEVVKAMEAR